MEFFNVRLNLFFGRLFWWYIIYIRKFFLVKFGYIMNVFWLDIWYRDKLLFIDVLVKLNYGKLVRLIYSLNKKMYSLGR